MKFLFCNLLVSLLLASGCAETPPGAFDFQVQLLMPKLLTKNEERYARFMGRVSHLRLTISSPSGGETVTTFPAEDWTAMTLPAVSVSADEKVKISAEVWDKTQNGGLRSFAVLRGETAVEGKKLTDEEGAVIPLSLSLRVSVSEYD